MIWYVDHVSYPIILLNYFPDSEKSDDLVLRRRSQIVNGATKRESNPFYRHSVAQMSTQHPGSIKISFSIKIRFSHVLLLGAFKKDE